MSNLDYTKNFIEKGYPDILMWLKPHAADNMVYICWEPSDSNDSGYSQILKQVVEAYFNTGKWVYEF